MERIGIIGGSGFYQLKGVEVKEEISLDTPFGEASDKFILAQWEEREVIFLPRHGRGHCISPSRINYRANIYGMKKLGAGWLISVAACGSLKSEIKPLDFVIPTQFVDRTNQARKYTFFEEVVVHVGFAHPVCEELASELFEGAKKVGSNVHYGGTYLNMEGPQFSTLAESNLYRSWGMDIIGMTNMMEARLAREAEICYATLAAVTDYDCWRETEEEVCVDLVLDNLGKNVNNAREILREVISRIPRQRTCSCQEALKCAIVTNVKFIPPEVKKKLDILIGKYVE